MLAHDSTTAVEVENERTLGLDSGPWKVLFATVKAAIYEFIARNEGYEAVDESVDMGSPDDIKSQKKEDEDLATVATASDDWDNVDEKGIESQKKIDWKGCARAAIKAKAAILELKGVSAGFGTSCNRRVRGQGRERSGLCISCNRCVRCQGCESVWFSTSRLLGSDSLCGIFVGVLGHSIRSGFRNTCILSSNTWKGCFCCSGRDFCNLTQIGCYHSLVSSAARFYAMMATVLESGPRAQMMRSWICQREKIIASRSDATKYFFGQTTFLYNLLILSQLYSCRARFIILVVLTKNRAVTEDQDVISKRP